MNYLDAFSGIGGFRKGLEEAGFRFGWVGFSEIDRYAKQIYKRRFPGAEDLGDVRTITSSGRLPGRLDLFTFGFPCQDLSLAGKRRGLHAQRSGLFFEALQIIKAARPTIFIFENVKGLLSSGDWRDFTTLLRAIADLGLYVCEWQLLNTQWFLPQNRERVYFIGHLRGESRPKVFPFGEGDQEFLELQRRVQRQIQDQRRGRKGWNPDDRLPREDGQLHKARARRLTPLECERLQGFPDGWTEGISDTQRYRCLGNAVSVPVVRAIGMRLLSGWKNQTNFDTVK